MDNNTIATPVELQTAGYKNYLYDSVVLPITSTDTVKVEQNCQAHCRTEGGGKCNFVIIDGATCFLGEVTPGGPWINPPNPFTDERAVLLMSGESTLPQS